MPHLIIVEGLIGSGKSTLCEKLGETLNYKVMYEPVAENPYLEKFYADPKRWALEMQYYLMSARFKMHQEAIDHIWKTGQSVIMDRSIYGDAVFCEKNYMDGNIDALGFRSYMYMRDVMFRFLMVPHITMYLNASPETCLNRIHSRGRDCEKGIPKPYLAGLDMLYQKLLIDLENRGSKIVRLDWEVFMSVFDIVHVMAKENVYLKNFEMYPEIK